MQRRREYQQEVREMQRRVMGRPLLLEQVAQVTTQFRTHHITTSKLRNYGRGPFGGVVTRRHR